MIPLLIAQSILCVAISLVYWNRRLNSPIKQREPLLVLFETLAINLYMISAEFLEISAIICFMMFCTCYSVRLFAVYLNYRSTVFAEEYFASQRFSRSTRVLVHRGDRESANTINLSEHSKRENVEDRISRKLNAESKFALWCKKNMNSGFWMIFILLVSTVFASPSIVYYAIGNQDQLFFNIIAYAWIGVCFAVGLYPVIRLRGSKENLKMTREFQWISLVWSSFIAATICDMQFNLRFSGYIVAFLHIILVQVQTIFWSFKIREDAKSPKAAGEKNEMNNIVLPTTMKEFEEAMLEMLSSPPSRKMFYEFLKGEFAIENLLFYESVEKFKSKYKSVDLEISAQNRNDLEFATDMKRQKMISAALQIYKYFIDDKAPFCVNLSFGPRFALRDMFAGAGSLAPIPEAGKKASPNPAMHYRGKSIEFLSKFFNENLNKSNPQDLQTILGTQKADDAKSASPKLMLSPVLPQTNASPDTEVESLATTEVNSSIFDAAQSEIVHLMTNDSMRRFVLTAEFAEYWNSHQQLFKAGASSTLGGAETP
jgi:hypothetical protein